MTCRHFSGLLIVRAGLTALGIAACSANEDRSPKEPAAPESVVVTQWNDSTELFLEYQPPVAGRAAGNWAIHLTDLDTFGPITEGTLTVRFLGRGAGPTEWRLERPARAGIFLLDPLIENAGDYRVELALDSPQAKSLHVLPSVRVRGPGEDLPPAGEGGEAGGIPFLKEQQWAADFATTPAAPREVRRSVSAPAEIVAADGSLANVTAPLGGIPLAGPNRSAPSVGDRIAAGQTLAVLAPVVSDDGYARTRASAERLEREAARAERLYSAGAVPLKRLEEARYDLEVVRAELTAMGVALDGDYQLRVRSPIAGIVASRSLVLGGRVEAGETLFTVVDPRRVWLRVRMEPTDASRLAPGTTATFTLGESEDRRVASRLVSVGSVLDPETRTVPAVFEAENADGSIKIGQFARAMVPVGGTERGIAIQLEAVLDDAGTSIAYVQAGGETFERRILSLGESDGAHVIVLRGIQEGERVVTAGAYQVRLASLSDVPLSGGHAH